LQPSERQVVKDAQRLGQLFSGFADLASTIGEGTTLKQAANEAASKLAATRAEIETAQAALDTKKAEAQTLEQQLAAIIGVKQTEIAQLDAQLHEKRGELERIAAARKQFIESVGATK
jgi:chromosome segregation ATPase